jgi:hypothetical protein
MKVIAHSLIAFRVGGQTSGGIGIRDREELGCYTSTDCIRIGGAEISNWLLNRDV